MGTMRIANISLLGDSNTCSKSLMAPDETLFCNMSRVLVQSEYEAGLFTLRANNISGKAYGPVVLPTDPADVSDVVHPNLTQMPELNVSVAVNRTKVYQAGDTVLYTITAVSAAGWCCKRCVTKTSHARLMLGLAAWLRAMISVMRGDFIVA